MDSDNMNRLINLEVENAVGSKLLEIKKMSKKAIVFASIAFGYIVLNLIVTVVILVTAL